MITLVVSLKQKINFKIQMLVGKSLISFLNTSSEENSTLTGLGWETWLISSAKYDIWPQGVVSNRVGSNLVWFEIRSSVFRDKLEVREVRS